MSEEKKIQITYKAVPNEFGNCDACCFAFGFEECSMPSEMSCNASVDEIVYVLDSVKEIVE